MAKRKKTKKPNIPQSTLDRAREQAAGTLDEGESTAKATAETHDSPTAEATVTTTDVAPINTPVPRRPAVAPARIKKNGGNKDKPLTGVMIANLLAHPTKVVTEEELHAEYGFVLADLRSMGILAAALMVLLVVLAQIL